ncbi:hypothetical protein QM012_000631 [Aureobasidium pullulans]|uniref:Uncharacterized protein n=1 Tax=Aureobasidium pullulans TaxID=5580 RepID=A0ABR0TW61_AURPU
MLPDAANLIYRHIMNVDVDDYLNRVDSEFAEGYSNNMHDAIQSRFELDGFNLNDNSADFDVFSNHNDSSGNSGNGGQGNVFFNSHQQQQFVVPPGLDGQWSAQTSQHGYNQPPDSNVSSFASHQGAQCDYASSNGKVEEVADSIEHENTAPEEEDEEDDALLNNEEHDSDADFKENDEENEEAEEGEDGQKKKKKRKPYSGPRTLIRWHTGQDQLALMALIYELEMDNIKVPYDRVCKHIQADCGPKGDALIQHLTKARKARIYYGLPVPPLPPHKRKTKKNGETDPDSLGDVTEKDIKVWTTLTYTKPGHENQTDDTLGTMPPQYTPLPIPGRPELPRFDPVTGAEVNMTRPPRLDTPPKTSQASKPASAPSKKRGKQTVEGYPLTEEGVAVTSTEKKGRSSKKAIKAEEEDDNTYSEKPTRKGQSTAATSKRKPALKPAVKATPSKPRGVTKSKKTPSTLNKKLSALMVNSPEANPEQADTPSKKPAASKKKAKVNATPVLEKSIVSEATPVAVNDAELSVQSYSMVSRDDPGMPTQSLENMLADLPSDRFQMGRHQASQSFDSHSTMSTVPSQSMLDTSAQFIPNGLQLQMQNNFPGNNYPSNGYGHHNMPSRNSSFAHGHDVSATVSGGKEQNMWHLGSQGQGYYPMQQYSNGYSYGGVPNYGPEPHGLGIMNPVALMPREPVELETELGNYSFASGPASNMVGQQQLYSNDNAQMQSDGNDIKLNMEQYMGSFTDVPNFEEGSNIFDDFK